MNKINQTTKQVVSFLSKHKAVKKIYYPFSEHHLNHEVAKRQMSGCPGLFSIELNTENERKIEAFVHKIKKFLMAVSWGGYESLMIPILAFYRIAEREKPNYPINLIRFYCGLEEADVLISDLEGALQEVD